MLLIQSSLALVFLCVTGAVFVGLTRILVQLNLKVKETAVWVYCVCLYGTTTNYSILIHSLSIHYFFIGFAWALNVIIR